MHRLAPLTEGLSAPEFSLPKFVNKKQDQKTRELLVGYVGIKPNCFNPFDKCRTHSTFIGSAENGLAALSGNKLVRTRFLPKHREA